MRTVALGIVLGLAAVHSVAFAAPPASGAAPSGTAPSPQDLASDLKKKGDSAMDALRYDEAIDDYTRAYALWPDAALLYNRGRVHQARGEWPDALADLEKFARDASPELRGRVPKLDALLADVRSHVATLMLTANVTGARVLVGDRQVGTTPLAGPLQLVAGQGRIEVLADGYFDWRKDVVLKGGGVTVIDAQLGKKATSGVLRVTATTPGTHIVIDDNPVGGSPAEEIVPAGSHRVVVRADGYDDKQTNIVVAVGESRDIQIEPDKRPSIVTKWWFWTGVGVVVAAGAVTTYALLTEKSASTGDHFQPGQVSGPLVRW